MERRKFLLTTSTLAVATAITTSLASLPVMAQDKQPIKIGLMAPLTGVVAAGGKEIVEGFQLFWEGQGMEVAGHPIEIIVEDDAGNPDTALQKARRLVEQEEVDFLFGNLL